MLVNYLFFFFIYIFSSSGWHLGWLQKEILVELVLSYNIFNLQWFFLEPNNIVTWGITVIARIQMSTRVKSIFGKKNVYFDKIYKQKKLNKKNIQKKPHFLSKHPPHLAYNILLLWVDSRFLYILHTGYTNPSGKCIKQIYCLLSNGMTVLKKINISYIKHSALNYDTIIFVQ